MKLNIFRANNQSSLFSLHNMEIQYWARTLTELSKYLSDKYTAILTDSRDILPDNVDKNTFVVLIGNEDYIIPEYRKKVGAVFTHYMKSDVVENVFVAPHGTMFGILDLPITNILDRTTPVRWYGWIHSNRAQVLNGIANELNNKNIKFDIQKHNSASCPPSVYSTYLMDSQFSLCLRGGRGPESFRYYESLKYGLVTLVPNDLPNNWLYKKSPAIPVEFNNANEVVNVIDDLLKKPEEMLKISCASVDFYINNFREDNVSIYLFKKLKEVGMI